MSVDELEAQHKRKEFISIQRFAIIKAENEALQKGIVLGIEKGKQERNINIAKVLLDVLDDDTISIKIRLSVAEIQALR